MIDLRSDTVTQPTAEMLDAMYAARLGDDSRDGDPTVGKLEALAAKRTGKEAAMFVPSGTMGNLVALMAHTGRGGEVLLEESSHILKSEMGAIAQVAGLFHRTIRGERGAMDLGTLAETIRAQMKPNKLATALIEMETTHNGAGGTVLPLDHWRRSTRSAGSTAFPCTPTAPGCSTPPWRSAWRRSASHATVTA